jgi:lipoprotein-releasing system permease protein
MAFSGLIIRLCIASSALSVAVMIVAMALINGFKDEITNKIFDFWGHIIVTDTEINNSFIPTPIDTTSGNWKELFKTTQDDVAPFNEHPSLFSIPGSGEEPVFKSVQSFIAFPGILKTKDEFEGITVKGIGGDFNQAFFEKYIVSGEAFTYNKDSIGRDLMLSVQTASRLNVEVGESMDIYFIKDGNQVIRRFNIKALYKTGLEEYDKKVAFADVRVLQQILGWKETEVGGMELYLHDISQMDPALNYLFDDFLPVRLFPVTIKERFPSIFEWLQLQDYNKVIIIVLMIAVCIFNLITTALILILERTNMVGMLKTLGMKNRSIRFIFVGFGMKILFYSLLMGNVTGLGLCWLQAKFKFIKLNEADYYLAYAPISIDWWGVLFLNILIVISIFISIILPTYLVQSISPLKAIKIR